ncbi:MAG: NYN domain-containing protein [Peptococcaceae bacterium]|nr:NYN domain-containing protein [Peptococcaceae bacterium]
MKAIAFVDYENIYMGFAESGKKLDPEDFVQALKKYADYIKADLLGVYLYANFDKEEFWKTLTTFEMQGVNIRHSYGKNAYTNTDVRQNAADEELMLEAMEILLTRPSEIDLVILLTGDGDFFPLIRRIRLMGKEVKVLGTGKINHMLQPYCDSPEVFLDYLNEITEYYDPNNDLKQAIQILGQLQLRLPYVASTKARLFLSKELGRSLAEVKELIQYMLLRKIISEKEHLDSNLRIAKTKIYLLNTKEPLVSEILGDKLDIIEERNSKLY